MVSEQMKALIRFDTDAVLRYCQAFERLAPFCRPAVASQHRKDTQTHFRPVSLIKSQGLAAGSLWLWCRALGGLLANDTIERSVVYAFDFIQR